MKENSISPEQTERACLDLNIVFDDQLTDRMVFETYDKIGNKTEQHRAAKMLILKKMASDQLVAGDKTHYRFDTPFKPCVECRGASEIFLLELEEKTVPCESCKGEAIKTVPCKDCEGSGKTPNGKGKCCLCRGNGLYSFRKNQYRKEDIPCPQCYDSNKNKAMGHRKVQISTGNISGSYPCTCVDGKLKVHVKKSNTVAKVKEVHVPEKIVTSSTMADAMAHAQEVKAEAETEEIAS